ncbi:hypothetical protein C8T65DRAFT_626499 [Cerioporus squamosus]|nr:hypothetical protein C8T65DRAFT_626499 [Cerioporus squamosus]
MANPGNVARGLKAGLSNPNTKEENREKIENRLKDMQASGEANSDEAHAAQVKQGHKAAINNPNVSEETKDRSRSKIGELEQ